MIIRRKSKSKYKHQFAIATFSSKNNFDIVADFTTHVEDLLERLMFLQESQISLAVSNNVAEPLDLALLLSNLQSYLKFSNETVDLPLTRCILIFGRSKEVIFLCISINIYLTESICNILLIYCRFQYYPLKYPS